MTWLDHVPELAAPEGTLSASKVLPETLVMSSCPLPRVLSESIC